MSGRIRVLVVGCGHMGAQHARAYRMTEGFELVGVVARRPGPRDLLAHELNCPAFGEFASALSILRPDAVCIATYPDTHAAMCIAAMRAGADVFVEKPLADDLRGAEEIVEIAHATGRTLLVGYILRHHPAWVRFVELARTL